MTNHFLTLVLIEYLAKLCIEVIVEQLLAILKLLNLFFANDALILLEDTVIMLKALHMEVKFL